MAFGDPDSHARVDENHEVTKRYVEAFTKALAGSYWSIKFVEPRKVHLDERLPISNFGAFKIAVKRGNTESAEAFYNKLHGIILQIARETDPNYSHEKTDFHNIYSFADLNVMARNQQELPIVFVDGADNTITILDNDCSYYEHAAKVLLDRQQAQAAVPSVA